MSSRKRIALLPLIKTIKRVCNIFQRSPRKSIKKASRELQMSPTTIWLVRKRLHPTPYKLHLKNIDKPASEDFCTQMQGMLEQDGFDDRLVFSNEATFHLTGKVKKRNTRMLGTEHLHLTLEHVRDWLKANVFCAILKK